MRNFIEENPWTCILASIGIIIGLFIPSSTQEVISNLNFNNITANPTEVLTGFMISYPLAVVGDTFMKLIISGFLGLIGAIIGIFIDIKRNSGVDYL